MTASGTSITVELAIYLATEPAAVHRVLRQHVDDGRGRCKVCALGAQRGNKPWPCITYRAATLASTMPRR